MFKIIIFLIFLSLNLLNASNQSPINIDKNLSKKINNSLSIIYSGGIKNIINTKYVLKIYTLDSNKIIFNSLEFTLKEFHFHIPAENTINNVRYPLELHFVHKNSLNQILVIGVLFKEGKENLILNQILTNVENSKKNLNLDLKDLLPKNKSYFNFKGSLTTKPYAEGIEWIVMEHPLELSKSQILKFQKLLENNARSLQPLNNRIIKYFKE
ncbi:carbonic anhydrase family protein [Campylobacter novaezeelandiae]|uniref:carbonic anhydrase n=1 Tax=Campylobacter novaezeelandiae TaxID=2267891 RepID=A0A4Q9JU22_9BACT|nr:carbonic anhydrase family protein [Campylobacter novaezeelandiae]QWU80314.1 carbonic anhydrase family protein [Campylobacter novaezeelandiae]TBR80060.1 carbonic anhydrase family protein [Campylobacter novaezeelandiae]TBR81105.1 carbonic anhydrase family protein [Campylobacter novaezeelandiae]